jgi:hypothetical protein
MISEIDIADFDVLPVESLYKIPRETYIQLPISEHVFFFDHIDGAYSFCRDMFGDIAHISAFAMVHPLKKKDPAKQ